MPRESSQKRISRVRAPRVHITYDLEVGDAIEMKELPFVMGVLGDFTGQRDESMKDLKDRGFVEITPDNFDSVLAGMKPRLKFSIDNPLSSDGSARKIAVDLQFKEFDDFSPAKVAENVEPIRKLLDLRSKLSNLRGSLQGNDRFDKLLFEAVSNTEEKQRLRDELGAKTEGDQHE